MTELPIDPDDEQKREGCHADWPQAVRGLAGCWAEFPQQEELRDGLGEDVARESL